MTKQNKNCNSKHELSRGHTYLPPYQISLGIEPTEISEKHMGLILCAQTAAAPPWALGTGPIGVFSLAQF